MSVLNRFVMATRQAAITFRDVFARPDTLAGQNQQRLAIYDILFDYYTNRAFDDIVTYENYLAKYKLYRRTRLVYNPVRRLVDFYAGQVYPGTVFNSPETQNVEQFQQAVPIVGASDELMKAIQQLWQWTNFQSLKSRYVRVGAMTGIVAVMILDDPDEAERIIWEVIFPSFIRDYTLDKSQNLKFFSVEYDAVDDEGQTFKYRKDITPEKIETFKDDQPWEFNGNPASYENPYGFVPVILAKHNDNGTDYGTPAVGGTISKIDELNSTASHLLDQIHKLISTAQLIATDDEIVPALKPKDASEAGIERSEAVLLLKTAKGASVSPLAGNMSVGDGMPYIESLMTEIEADHPELTFWGKLREMSQVTGPGAARLMGDVQGKVWEAAANYDQQLIKLIQMSVAIAGWRLAEGDWEENNQTSLFATFDLDSYKRGQLDLGIAPRPLVPMSESEEVEQDQKRASYAITFASILAAEDILVLAGFDQAEAREMATRGQAEKDANAERQMKTQAAIAESKGIKPGDKKDDKKPGDKAPDDASK